jgi:hypothetical protein|tara:strand:- start:652 stop:966 length:315 start_codon:yes stop_codon:yes gene_type:complete
MTTFVKAIKAINPNAQFKYENDDIDNITWLNDTTPISKSDIVAKKAELQTTYDNNKYQRDRKTEYPNIGEQLDKLYHDMTAGKLDATGEWHKTIKAVKDKYAKE